MSDPLPPEFWHGIQQFNQQEFYACHDTLEAIWLEASEPERTLYQGILQLAVGIYHLSNQNLRGAMILLGEGIGRLSRYQPDYAGLDIRQLLIQSKTLLTELQQASLNSADRVNIDEYSQLLPKIEFVDQTHGTELPETYC
jgi:predicted metal-dependent hydrolase